MARSTEGALPRFQAGGLCERKPSRAAGRGVPRGEPRVGQLKGGGQSQREAEETGD